MENLLWRNRFNRLTKTLEQLKVENKYCSRCGSPMEIEVMATRHRRYNTATGRLISSLGMWRCANYNILESHDSTVFELEADERET